MAEPISAPVRFTPPQQGAVTADGTLLVHEPGSGKLLGEVRVSTAQQVREAVAQAREAQAGWARRTFALSASRTPEPVLPLPTWRPRST